MLKYAKSSTLIAKMEFKQLQSDESSCLTKPGLDSIFTIIPIGKIL